MVSEPAQFAICENRGASSNSIPYLLCLQHPFAAQLTTRLVAPIEWRSGTFAGIPRTLVELDVHGSACVAIIPEMAAVKREDIGSVVAVVDEQRYEIIGAIDFLINGY